MSVRWCLAVGVFWSSSVAPASVRAQNAASVSVPSSPPSAPIPRFAHGKKLRVSYDSVADSTRLTVTTHKGKYFLTIQRPRLTWSVSYQGRRPSKSTPEVVTLEVRTQSPQVALNSQLTISFAAGRRLETPSVGAYSDPGVQTSSHFMRFLVPSPDLAEALQTDTVSITVGGITERLNADHINALRDLLARVGAWPPGRSASEGT